MCDPSRTDALLAWYDDNARAMPWRVGPAARKEGLRPDPYHVWLSEVMLQQTTVAAVKSYFHSFTETWPTVLRFARAGDDAVMARLGWAWILCRARNLLRMCAAG